MRFKGKPKPTQHGNSRGCGIDSSWESGSKIGKAHTEGRVFETKTGEVANGCDITNTAAIRPADASSDVDLLLKRPRSDLHTKKGENDTSMRSWESCDSDTFHFGSTEIEEKF